VCTSARAKKIRCSVCGRCGYVEARERSATAISNFAFGRVVVVTHPVKFSMRLSCATRFSMRNFVALSHTSGISGEDTCRSRVYIQDVLVKTQFPSLSVPSQFSSSKRVKKCESDEREMKKNFKKFLGVHLTPNP